ncbi:DEAD-domain-containing protein [Syncephalis pseudoplumigaleata]|uniref:RNA helicase n=1 Tax=Syncephalis pseudoplumigaleata TaxID=1712513 RepID=A0A4P9Z662_9FUNG|nr:DEAD-domain-containing protein [Syncephalis pseudoplumigaleata]|eukprot:RKP28133.1 DEAD-domain-containing protein [Syncephalis pseudoplumigaleata]
MSSPTTWPPSRPRTTAPPPAAYEVEVTLADKQADPNSPLYSVKSFEELNLYVVPWPQSAPLIKGIYEMKFTKPSKIQERALPLLLSDPPKNMIGQSQSGTGKTAAFVLTMLTRIDPTVEATQAICLAPARELARQIMDVVTSMGKYTDITACFALPGEDSTPSGPIKAHIVIGTPGKLGDLMKRRLINPSKVRVFVLDEADNMIDQQGLGDQSLRIRAMMPKTCQIVLFSATYAERVKQFADRFAPNANQISLKQEELSVDGIKQFFMDCKDESHKFDVLVALYSLLTIGQSIIFVKRRDTADEIARRMSAEGHAVISLHGKQEPAERDFVIDSFRSGKSKVLITTNVLARGIDILQVNMVVNYDIPLDGAGNPDPETYLHRIGRTGRFGRTGVSINFVHDRTSWEQMNQIEQYFNRPITRVPTDDFEELERILRKAI